jgi:aminopeptidase N/puromycin-sensitive aminopeptidase
MRRLAVAVTSVLLALPAFAWRLPQDVVPSNYKLRFVPDLASETFTGEETISVTVKKATSTVQLNAAEIEFDEVTITSAGTTQKATVSYDASIEIATLTVAKPLAPGPATIDIRYRGLINDKLRGFYISKSARRKYAVTQFEPTDARRAFPSFDEPAFKATYDITLVVDNGDTAISNSKIAKDEPGPIAGKHTITFERTKKMSTYLVAMLVGDWQCSEGNADGIPVRVCATPEKKDQTKWGLVSAVAELKYYNQYYDFKYPFGKLDIITFPDFEAGAMENAGAITFREAALLVDDNASAFQRKTVANVNSHEIAHMWFGDVVTMQWWDDIWLNEGFATWITDKPIAAWKPEWDVDVDNATETSTSLAVDSMESTRAIRSRADSPAEINQMFDGIAYGKTAAVLRMLESYVGENTFRDGIRAYIKKYQYANARAEDFWSTMTEVTKQPIDKMMPSFVVQAGVPLVRASAQCEGNKTVLTLAQQRMYSRRARFLEGSPQLWTIPVTVRNLDDPKAAPRKFLLTAKDQTFRIDGCSPHLFVNYDGRGFYRTSHAAGMIPSGDLTKVLSPSERIALLNDTWSLVKIGEADIAGQLALINRLRNERQRAVMNAILGQLSVIGQELVTEEQAPAYRGWVSDYLKPMIAEMGWTPAKDESDERKQLRAGVLNVLGLIGRDEETLAKARELTELALKDPGAVDPTLTETVVPLAAIHGDAELLAKMKKAIAEAKSPGQYYRYLYALISFEDPALRKEAFAAALAPEMRSQDLPHYVGSMFEKPVRRQEAWDFVKTNWSELQKKFTPWGGASLVASTGSMCDAKQREDVQQFFAAHPVQASERSLNSALERIDMCVEMRTLQTRNFAAWLQTASGAQEHASAP